MSDDQPIRRVDLAAAAVLVAVPIVGGAALFVLFEAGAVHRLGLYLMAAGVIVGLAVAFVRFQES